jgi:hypothetical protein
VFDAAGDDADKFVRLKVKGFSAGGAVTGCSFIFSLTVSTTGAVWRNCGSVVYEMGAATCPTCLTIGSTINCDCGGETEVVSIVGDEGTDDAGSTNVGIYWDTGTTRGASISASRDVLTRDA